MSRRIKIQISILKSSISTLSCWINLKKVFLKNKMSVTKKLILKCSFNENLSTRIVIIVQFSLFDVLLITF